MANNRHLFWGILFWRVVKTEILAGVTWRSQGSFVIVFKQEDIKAFMHVVGKK